MRIAIIGTGNIGTGLGRKWSTMNHVIIYGVRDVDSAKLATLKAEKAKIAEIQDAVNASDVVVLAVPFQAVEEVLANTHGLTTKIVIDATNAISAPLPAGYASAAEAIAFWSKCRKVVKAFNTTGADNLNNPVYNGEKIESFICGDDTLAKALVAKLVEDTGFTVIDVGNLEQAVLLENLAKLWVTLAYKQGMGPDMAFKLVKR